MTMHTAFNIRDEIDRLYEWHQFKYLKNTEKQQRNVTFFVSNFTKMIYFRWTTLKIWMIHGNRGTICFCVFWSRKCVMDCRLGYIVGGKLFEKWHAQILTGPFNKVLYNSRSFVHWFREKQAGSRLLFGWKILCKSCTSVEQTCDCDTNSSWCTWNDPRRT